jgi:hypothetical protein
MIFGGNHVVGSVARWIFPLWIFFSMLSLPPVTFSGDIPAAGSTLPKFQLQAPESDKDREYLGIGNVETFAISQINCLLVLIEIVGVYCPQCHVQAPLFNKLFYRIKKNSDVYKKTKMIAVAAGANPMEATYLRKEFRLPFPVITDPKFQIHKVLREPRTPFTMLVTKEEKVVFAHLGVIKDIDKFLRQIKKFIR